MAEDYTIVATNVVTEFLPPNRQRNVHEVTAQAEPSGVIFYLRFQREAFTPANVARTVQQVAAGLNRDAEVPGVVGIRIEQDLDANGQIIEYGIVTIESSSGDSTTERRGVQTWLYLTTFDDVVAAERAKLDAIEAL